MESNEILAYLDHNILDLMTKGDPHNVKELLQKYGLTPIYSDETLKEIQRSKGYENRFLGLLEDIGAKYIEPTLDSRFKQTGQARIHSDSPKSRYEHFLSNQNECLSGDFGLSEMLMKFYGGKKNRSFEEIVGKGSIDLHRYLLKNIDGIDTLPLISDITKNLFTMTKELDKLADSPISAFEKETGLGPIVLNNIKPPNVVEKIWQMVSEKINQQDMDIDIYFGVKPHSFDQDADRELTLQEKVNAIYHHLNFLGYYRDSKMKKERRFKASFSDMTHAGIASFCHLFLCRDENLVMKTAAAFEYLGVKTKILYYEANKSIQSIANGTWGTWGQANF